LIARDRENYVTGRKKIKNILPQIWQMIADQEMIRVIRARNRKPYLPIIAGVLSA
jgi:nuclear transport factor 2 (NTF2) superfamily protein